MVTSWVFGILVAISPPTQELVLEFPVPGVVGLPYQASLIESEQAFGERFLFAEYPMPLVMRFKGSAAKKTSRVAGTVVGLGLMAAGGVMLATSRESNEVPGPLICVGQSPSISCSPGPTFRVEHFNAKRASGGIALLGTGIVVLVVSGLF